MLGFGNWLINGTGQGENDQAVARMLENSLRGIFPDVEYDETSSMFRVECLRRNEEGKAVAKFSFDRQDVDLYVDFLEKLYRQITDGNFTHLYLQEVREEKVIRFQLRSDAENEYQLKTEVRKKNSQDLFVNNFKIPKFDIRKFEEVLTEQNLKYIEDDVEEIEEIHIEYVLEGSNSLGKFICIDVDLGEPRKIIDIYHNSWCNFVDIFISFFVDYHLICGSFEKIKICNNCKKFYLEKKRGRSRYCSDACRSQARSGLDRDENKCQQRQRIFLNSAYDRVNKYWPKFPGNEDCRKCNIDHKQDRIVGGECAVVKKNNKQLIKEYEKVKWKRLKQKQ